jgi:thiosulfate oxidation carrier complex protein SoxZ
MAESGSVRIRLPSAIRPGEVIRVRALVIHPMDLVQRDKQGKIVQKRYNFIDAVSVTYNGKEIMRAETTQAISQNPMFTFPLKVDRPGELTVRFSDTTGHTYEANTEVKFG